MVNVKELYAKISASANGFNETMDSIANKTEKTQRKVNKSGNEMGKGWTNAGNKLSNVSSKLSGFGEKTTKLGKSWTKASSIAVGAVAGIGGAVVGLTKKYADQAETIADHSKQMGISAKRYQEYDYWAKENGMSTEQMEKAVGRLNQRMGKAAAGDEKYSQALEDVGINMEDVRNGTLDTDEAFEQAVSNLSKMDSEQEKVAKATELFGTRMARQLLPALQDSSLSMKDAKQQFKELGLEIDVEAGQKFNETWRMVTNQFKSFGFAIANEVLPYVQEFMTWILQHAPQIKAALQGAFEGAIDTIKMLVHFFTNLSPPIQKAIALFSALAVAAGPVLLVIGKLATTLAPVIGMFGKFATWIGKLGGLLGLLTNPIGIAVAAIVGLGTAFTIAYTKSETFRNFINGIGEIIGNAIGWFVQLGKAIRGLWGNEDENEQGQNLLEKLGFTPEQIEMLQTIIDRIKSIFINMGIAIKGVFDKVVGTVKGLFTGINEFIAEYGPQIMQAIQNFVQMIQPAIQLLKGIISTQFQAILQIIRGVFMTVWNVVKSVWNGIVGVIQGALQMIQGIIQIFAGIFTGDFSLMWEGIKNIFFGALNIIKSIVMTAFNVIKSIIVGVMTTIGNVIRTVWNGIKSTIYNVAMAIWTNVKNIFTMLKNSVIAIWNGLKATTLAIWNGLKAGVVGLITGLKNTALNIFRALRAGVQAVWNGIKAAASATWNWIKNTVVRLATSLKNGVVNLFNALKGAISAIWAGVKSATSAAWNWIKSTAIRLATGLKNTVTNLFNALKSVISSIWNGIKSVTSSVWNGIKSIATSLANGLKSGVTNTFNALKGAITGIWNGIKGATSKVWNGIKDTVTGFAESIKDGVTGSFDAMKDTLGNIIDGIKGFIGDMVDGVVDGLNKLIKGINWVSDKIMGKELLKEVKLSTGTTGKLSNGSGALKQGTMATVGDKGKGNGKGRSGRRELIESPSGALGLTPNRDTNLFLPAGFKVHSGEMTQKFMNDFAPKFSEGTGGGGGNIFKDSAKWAGKKIGQGASWAKDKGTKAAKAVGKGAGWLKDKVGDVMDYITKPEKLMDKVLEAFGVPSFKDATGVIGDISAGAFKKLKDGFLAKIKEWFSEKGGDGDGKYIDISKGNINFPFDPDGTNPDYPFGGAHNGVDLNYKYDPLYSVISGTAKGIPDNGNGFGNYMSIKDGALEVIYGHMSKLAWEGNKKVKPGDKLGISGNTGQSTGPHLHFEVRKNGKAIDPIKFVQGLGGKAGKAKPANQWKSDIKKAAKATGTKVSAGDVDDIASLINAESSGDPGATQSGVDDVNSRVGNPAQGLLQYIPQTFKKYAVKGHNNIKSGYDQLLAFFNNKNWKSQFNPNGGWSPTGPVKGYAKGGIIDAPEMAWLAEGGFSESVISHDPKHRMRSKAIHDKTGEMLGIDTDTQLLREIVELIEVTNNLQSTNNNFTKQIANKSTNVYMDNEKVTKNVNRTSGHLYDSARYNQGG